MEMTEEGRRGGGEEGRRGGGGGEEGRGGEVWRRGREAIESFHTRGFKEAITVEFWVVGNESSGERAIVVYSNSKYSLKL